MKATFSTLLIAALLTVAGCDKSSTGGPGAKPGEKPPTTPAGGTFTLSLSPDSMSVKQGEAKAFTVTISRKDNFQEEVKLGFERLPKGASVDPAHPVIKHGDTEVKFTIKTDEDAALGDFKVNMIGHPTRGIDTVSEMKITIDKK